MYIDSHCHLNYLDNPQNALERARKRDVSGCLCISVEQAYVHHILKIAHNNDDVWASIGEHPGNCSGDATWINHYLDDPKVVAVGETGLDYHYETDPNKHTEQRKTFTQQLEIAERARLPVIVHTRGAAADTQRAIESFPKVTGVMHCFTESLALAEAAIDIGYYISISGIVTFKNAENVREVARHVPIDRLLIETDAPWLAPIPHRGKQNEPGYVVDTAQYLADLLELDVVELARITRQNFFRLFSRAHPAVARPGDVVQ